MLRRILPTALALCAALALATPVYAQPALPDFEPAEEEESSSVDAGQVRGGLGNLEKQLGGSHGNSGSGASAGRLLTIVQALKSGKKVAPADLAYLKTYLKQMGGNHSDNGQLTDALEKLGGQLDQMTAPATGGDGEDATWQDLGLED